MRGPWLKLVLALATLGLLAGAAPAVANEDFASQPPFGGELPPPLVEPDSAEPRRRPASSSARGRRSSAPARAAVVRDELAETPERAAERIRCAAALAGELLRLRAAHEVAAGDRRRRERRGRRGVARPPARDAARPRLFGRHRPEGERPLRLAAALPAVPGAVHRPSAPLPPPSPRPAGAARPRRLAVVLQPRRDHRLGAAHLPGAGLLPASHAGGRAAGRGSARAR